jgi:rubredoxin
MLFGLSHSTGHDHSSSSSLQGERQRERQLKYIAETRSPTQCDRSWATCPIIPSQACGDNRVCPLCGAEPATFKEATKELLIVKGKAHAIRGHKEHIRMELRRSSCLSIPYDPSQK